jgi:GT2 family glycosyltransferase
MTPVAVCIVGFRDPHEILGCLDALGRSEHQQYEVVICENGGTDAVAEMNRQMPAALPGGQSVTVIDAGGNLGFAGGVNRAMQARPDARAWWVLNPDTRPEPGAMGALLRRLEQGSCAMVGGILYRPTGEVQGYGGRWLHWAARPVSLGNGDVLGTPVDIAAVEAQMDYVLGASMMVSPAMVKQVGLMREDYFLYAEEVEWGLRAKKAGLKLGFAPDARVCHMQGTTTGSNLRLDQRPRMPIYLDERNKLNVVRDTAPMVLPVAIPAALILTLLRFARRGAWKQQGYALSGWLAGIVNRRGPPPWLTIG